MADVNHCLVNGNGYDACLPQSKKTFARLLPGRLDGLEDQVDALHHSVDELRARLSALEACADATSDLARAEAIWGVSDALRLALGKRRSKRRPQRGLNKQSILKP